MSLSLEYRRLKPNFAREIRASDQQVTNKDRAEQLIGVSVLEDDIRYDLLASNSDMYY